VPVAGADRLVLTEHIAVMDLMALADCLLLEEDDLALASVLKSPLFGLTEEQLFDVAWNRKISLRASLRSKADDAPFGAVGRTLDELAQVARAGTPFAFFAHVLGALRGRAKFLARLGPEANDALDEFLNLALDYEARETPSLQGFLAWLRAAKSDVRRDMEMARDEVRVMTVHGAKGLEAGTVILADTTTEPKGAHPPKLLTLADGATVWATRKQDDVGTMGEARDAADEAARHEYRRLLYVAMTRAAERLIVCGAQGDRKIPEGCWYQLVENALMPDCVAEPAEDGDGEVWRYRKFTEAAAQPVPPPEPVPAKAPVLPNWLRSDAPREIAAAEIVRPSRTDEAEEVRRVPAAGVKAALLRGALTHRLLQSLPDIPPAQRMQAAQDYLARAGDKLQAEDRTAVAEQVMRVIDHPDFRALFAPGSRAEVPIVGRLHMDGRVFAVSGQIDRLVVTPDTVLIADFKTNRPPPRRIEAVPPGYVRQLALYRAVLTGLYPGRRPRAALVWTEVPDLMELSGEVLDAALARLTSA
jgi:ATP-dependent helicase/nuclease subunit A